MGIILESPGHYLSQSTSDNHSWQEQSSWHICSIRDCHLDVPGTHEYDEAGDFDLKVLTHQVRDDFTLTGPEDGGQGVVGDGTIFLLAPSYLLVVLHIIVFGLILAVSE